MSAASGSPSAEPFYVVIPARYASTRLPAKPLQAIGPYPMVFHTYARALESGAAEVVVATDDARIRQACEDLKLAVLMTSTEHRSGTDRAAEVARLRQWPADAVVINLQCDEPFLDPALIRTAAAALVSHVDAGIATLAVPIQARDELFDPHAVKVVLDAQGWARYFSRAPIPWHQAAFAQAAAQGMPEDVVYYRHIGLYAFRVDTLHAFTQLAPCALEQVESLEQLRAIWHGMPIFVATVAQGFEPGIDTPEDLARARKRYAQQTR